MRTAVLLPLLAACVGSTQAPPSNLATVNPVKLAIAASVKLSNCSSVRVEADLIVTAHHCLPEKAKVGDAYEGGTLVALNADFDFALFRTAPSLNFAQLNTTAELGDRVFVVGWPSQLTGGTALTVTDGVIAGLELTKNGHVRITAPVYFGNSGGGVWSDRGDLVGIAVSMYAVPLVSGKPIPYEGQGFMVPIWRVAKAISALN